MKKKPSQSASEGLSPAEYSAFDDLSPAEYDQALAALLPLPPGTIIQKMDIYYERPYLKDKPKKGKPRS